MTDILIRDISDAALGEIDRLAAEAKISRNEYLRRWVNNGFRPVGKVTRADLARFAEMAKDLADPEIMRQAWS